MNVGFYWENKKTDLPGRHKSKTPNKVLKYGMYWRNLTLKNTHTKEQSFKKKSTKPEITRLIPKTIPLKESNFTISDAFKHSKPKTSISQEEGSGSKFKSKREEELMSWLNQINSSKKPPKPSKPHPQNPAHLPLAPQASTNPQISKNLEQEFTSPYSKPNPYIPQNLYTQNPHPKPSIQAHTSHLHPKTPKPKKPTKPNPELENPTQLSPSEQENLNISNIKLHSPSPISDSNFSFSGIKNEENKYDISQDISHYDQGIQAQITEIQKQLIAFSKQKLRLKEMEIVLQNQYSPELQKHILEFKYKLKTQVPQIRQYYEQIKILNAFIK